MSTVISKDTTSSEISSVNHSAPKKILRSVYESVLTALQEDKKVILITGDAKKGKTALIHTVSKDIAKKNRIITISGKDLPSSNKHKGNSSNSELYNMKDFFLKSTDLGDRLIVALDDAHCLPINFLSELIKHAKNSSANTHRLQLIMSGPLTFKDQLMSIEQIGSEDLVHYPMNTLSEQVIQSYAQTKTYKISSNIKQLKFRPESLHALADFIQANQKVLDVVLEWCAALTKKDQLTSISSQTVNRAVSFAQQYAKDKNLNLDNAYPSSHEVYKYINNAQSTQKSASKTSIESAKKPNKTKPHKKNTIQKVNNPASTSTKEDVEKSIQIQPVDNETLQSPHAAKIESMPLQWTSPPKRETAKIKSFPAMAGLIIFLLLGFIAFIAFRIGPNPSVEDSPKEQVNLNPSEETIVEKQLTSKVITTTENTLDINVQPQKPTSVTEEDNKQNEPAIAIIPNSSATIQPDDQSIHQPDEQNKTLSKTPANELTRNEKALKPEKNIQTTDVSTPSAGVNELLLLAEHQLENKRLSTPAGDNALETYRNILANDPNNKTAINGIKKVRDRYLNWANYYLQNNEVERATNFYNKALSIDPNDTVAITKLQTIAQQEAIPTTKFINESNTVVPQNNDQASPIQNLLVTAQQNMQQIEIDIGANNRNYSSYQAAQTAYQEILRAEPQNQQAKQGLSLLKNYYTDWGELQVQSKNYNIALFLYGQALAIEPENTQITQRIEQLLELKKAL